MSKTCTTSEGQWSADVQESVTVYQARTDSISHGRWSVAEPAPLMSQHVDQIHDECSGWMFLEVESDTHTCWWYLLRFSFMSDDFSRRQNNKYASRVHPARKLVRYIMNEHVPTSTCLLRLTILAAHECSKHYHRLQCQCSRSIRAGTGLPGHNDWLMSVLVHGLTDEASIWCMSLSDDRSRRWSLPGASSNFRPRRLAVSSLRRPGLNVPVISLTTDSPIKHLSC